MRSRGIARPYVIREPRDCCFMKLERTRASDERPAMAMPMCESISITFF